MLNSKIWRTGLPCLYSLKEEEMKIKIPGMLLTLIILLSIPTFAQELQLVKGSIFDNDGKPIPLVTVSLIDAQDSVLVKTGMSDEKGEFEIIPKRPGIYLLSYSSVGYELQYSPSFELLPGASLVLQPVKLNVVTKKLHDVTVTSKKQLIQVKPGRLVFNVQQSINSTGSNALELLQKSPGVTVDNNENISMKGKTGVQVYIDGKMIQLSSEDLAAYLKSINSNDIEAIELISNPGAKYDASGSAGVINIRLRKSANLGANGSVAAGYTQGITPKGTAGFNGNYRKDKVNVFSNLSTSVGKNETSIIAPRIQKDTLYDQFLLQYSKSNSYNIKLGMDLFLNQKHTIGIMNSSTFNEDDWASYGNTKIVYEPSGEYVKRLDAMNIIPRRRTSINTNLNYRYADTSGKEINLDADYGLFRGRAKSYQPNFYIDKFNNLISEVITYNNTPTDIDIYTAKLDVTIPKWKGRLSYGLKFAHVRTENTLDFFNDDNGHKVKAPERSYEFIYSENVNAGYISYDRNYSSWSLQAGLRLEQTNSEGNLTRGDGLIQPDNNVKRNYVDFFPNILITHTPNNHHRFSIGYGRRIDRPNYQSLNPFELKLDELSYVKGNSFLNPQYTDNIEMTYTWHNQLNASIGYSHVKDLATQTVDTLNNFTYAYTRNLANQQIFNVSISSPFSITKWWSGFANAWFSYQIFDGKVNGNPVNLELPSFGSYLQQTIQLPKDFSMEMSGWFNGPLALGPTLKSKSMGGIDLGIQKLLFDKKVTLKIAATDIFRTAVPFRAKTDYGGVLLRFWVTRESQLLRINLTYRFGNSKVKGARQRQAGLDNETKRITTN